MIYLQDNGACAEGMGRGSNEAKRQPDLEGRMAADQLAAEDLPHVDLDGRSRPVRRPWRARPTATAYGRGRANARTPFRGFKHDAYEGGLSTPFIVHWPARYGAAHGSIVAARAPDRSDADAAGRGRCRLPRELRGQRDPAHGGVTSWTPGPAATCSACPLAFEHHGNLALRDGRWKIVSQYRAKQPRTWELYDMEEDRTGSPTSPTTPRAPGGHGRGPQAWADRVGVRTGPLIVGDPRRRPQTIPPPFTGGRLRARRRSECQSYERPWNRNATSRASASSCARRAMTARFP